MKKYLFLVFTFFAVNLFAIEKVYILPKEDKKAFKQLENLIKNSSKQIDIAVYNFEYKKVAKLLKKASKKGVKVNILFEKSKLKNKKAKYDYLCENKNINCKVYKKAKQHIKLMIFDNKTVMFGSANLTKESFSQNLELIYFSEDVKIVDKLSRNFIKLFE